MQVLTRQRQTYMKKKDIHSNKDFGSSTGRATRIRKIAPLFYFDGDSSVFEILKCKINPLFQKYKQTVETDPPEEYEMCKECSQVHNELTNRTYNDIKTSIDVASELFRKAKVMEPI